MLNEEKLKSGLTACHYCGGPLELIKPVGDFCNSCKCWFVNSNKFRLQELIRLLEDAKTREQLLEIENKNLKYHLEKYGLIYCKHPDETRKYVWEKIGESFDKVKAEFEAEERKTE